MRENCIGLQGNELFRECLHMSAGWRVTIVDADVAAVIPTAPFQSLAQRH